MTSIPASRSARAMIFAPRSGPPRPGLATTTRILRVEVASSIEAGILCRVELLHDQLHRLVLRAVDAAVDRVGARAGELALVGTARLGAGVELDRALADDHGVDAVAGEPPGDRGALLDRHRRHAAGPHEVVVAHFDAAGRERLRGQDREAGGDERQ